MMFSIIPRHFFFTFQIVFSAIERGITYCFFGMSLAYTADGNIKEQKYRTAITKAQYTTTGLFTDTYDIEPSQEFVFNYKYDNFKRLQSAELKRADNMVFMLGDTSITNPGVTYDANGNIKTMKRIANGVLVDNLNYTYNTGSPNRLASITDGGTTTYAKASSYTYYTDGSVKSDTSRGITDGGITYNNQKLVSKIVANGVNYEYTYTNGGQKLRMYDGSKRYDYIGNAVYRNDTLEFVGNAEGRWIPANQLRVYNANKTAVPLPAVAKYGRYEYQLKDHLGNLRASCRCLEKPNATESNQAYPTLVTQENHYDPWGVAIEQEVVADKTKLPSFELQDRFTYNGKELQGTLNYLDYGARMYDATIGRENGIDQLSELDFETSPYAYAGNNPVRFVDLFGLKKGDANDPHQLAEVTVKAKRLPQYSDFWVNVSSAYNRNQSLYGHPSPYREHFQSGGRDALIFVGGSVATIYGVATAIPYIAQGYNYVTWARTSQAARNFARSPIGKRIINPDGWKGIKKTALINGFGNIFGKMVENYQKDEFKVDLVGLTFDIFGTTLSSATMGGIGEGGYDIKEGSWYFETNDLAPGTGKFLTGMAFGKLGDNAYGALDSFGDGAASSAKVIYTKISKWIEETANFKIDEKFDKKEK